MPFGPYARDFHHELGRVYDTKRQILAQSSRSSAFSARAALQALVIHGSRSSADLGMVDR
jgi:hypothetical protein